MLAEVERGVAEANSHLARAEQVRRWVLLPAEWTARVGRAHPVDEAPPPGDHRPLRPGD